jgi:transaldolase
MRRVEIFADGADLEHIRVLALDPMIRGFTTNPTLIRKAGVANYETFARAALDVTGRRPISFEVFSDELEEMRAQARAIASWGPAVNVKIPITNTKGVPTAALVADLTADGIAVNVTAMFTRRHVESILEAVRPDARLILSVFAGRIADAGHDPVPPMREAVAMAAGYPRARVLWASPREVLNVVQADEIGCHIITLTPDLIAKLRGIGKDLDSVSLETVRMFHDDAKSAGYTIATDDVAAQLRAAS